MHLVSTSLLLWQLCPASTFKNSLDWYLSGSTNSDRHSGGIAISSDLHSRTRNSSTFSIATATRCFGQHAAMFFFLPDFCTLENSQSQRAHLVNQKLSLKSTSSTVNPTVLLLRTKWSKTHQFRKEHTLRLYEQQFITNFSHQQRQYNLRRSPENI